MSACKSSPDGPIFFPVFFFVIVASILVNNFNCSLVNPDGKQCVYKGIAKIVSSRHDRSII